MELDLRYNQHFVGLAGDGKNSGQVKENKPYQELVDYFEANKSNFYYEDFVKNIITPQGNTEFSLSDGTKVLIGNGIDVINIAIQYPNKLKFMGMWTKLPDAKDFMEKSKNIAES